MIGNGAGVQSELASACWSVPSSPSSGIWANTCLWIPLHLDLIFSCLNLFKWFQLQSIAEKPAKRNSIRPELEIRSCDARLGLKKHFQPERKKGKDFFFVVIYFATCLSRLRLSRSFTIGFNKVMHPQTGLERLLSLCQFRRNFPALAQEYSFHSSLRLTRLNLRSCAPSVVCLPRLWWCFPSVW